TTGDECLCSCRSRAENRLLRSTAARPCEAAQHAGVSSPHFAEVLMKTVCVAIAALGAIATVAGAGNVFAQDGAGCTHANRIINTTLRVRDLDRALKFYVEGLGMHERNRRMASKDVTELSVGYSNDARVAELMLVHNKAQSAAASAEAQSAASSAWGHIILEVKDVKATIENVAKAGGKVIRQPCPTASVPVIVAFVEDPDGHQFELVQFK